MQFLKRTAAAFVAASFLFLAIGSLASAEAGTAAKAVAVHNYTAVWWKAPAGSEAGWGINFAHQGDIIFATWFTYDADGKPQWFIAAAATRPATTSTPARCRRVTGPPFDTEPFTRRRIVETTVGTTTRHLRRRRRSAHASPTRSTASRRPRRSCRQEFAAPVPTCVWGAQPDLARATNYQDLWWARRRARESGWGINFTHQGNIIFATWFTYDADGKPWWLIALADRTAPQGLRRAGVDGDGSCRSTPSRSIRRRSSRPSSATRRSPSPTATTPRSTTRSTACSRPSRSTRQVFAGAARSARCPTRARPTSRASSTSPTRRNAGTIGDEQFAIELQALLATIDGADGALQRLEAYLEAQVVGHPINFPIPAAAKAGAANKALTTAQFDAISIRPPTSCSRRR